MGNANTLLTSSDRERIRARIAALEKRTDAQVVCAVATESGRYDRAESLCGLVVAVLALVTAHKIGQMSEWDAHSALPIGWQVAFIVVGYVVGATLASYWHGLRRLLVSSTEMAAEVDRCTHQVFSRYGIGATRQRGGVLVYVSLFEHRVEVHCDHAAAQKLATRDLEALRDVVLAGIRAGGLTHALIAALDNAEELLANAFPPEGGETRALSDEVLVFHPRP